MSNRLKDYKVYLEIDQQNAIFRAEQAWQIVDQPSHLQRVVDVGCGSGEFLKLARAYGVPKVIGLEGPTHVVTTARINGLQVEQLDIETETFPFEDQSFDLAVCMETLEHLYDPAQVLDKIGRVLKPGGQLILSVPNAANLHYRARILLGRSISPPETVGGHIKFFRPQDLVAICEAKGFRVEKLRGVAYPTAYKRYGPLISWLLKLSLASFSTWIFADCRKK